MSDAIECDRCGALCAEGTPATVSLDISVKRIDGQTSSSWSDVDLCPKCSRAMLSFIAPALNNLDRALEGTDSAGILPQVEGEVPKVPMKLVRVGVVIDHAGEYWASQEVNEMEHGEVVYWIEAEVPLPDAPKARHFAATLVDKEVAA